MTSTAIQLTPSQLSYFLEACILAHEPVLVSGAPGIGKTSIAEQVIAKLGQDMIVSFPSVEDPTDVKGFPWMTNGEASFVPFGTLKRALTATVPTVWVVDDIGQGSDAMQKAYMQLFLARRVNDQLLSDQVTFIGCTNRRGDRAGVAGLLEPLKSRFLTIIELVPELADVCTWGLDHGWPPMLVAFLRSFPGLLSDFHPTADLTNSPSPRTWGHVAKLLQMNLREDILPIALAGAVGEGAATELIAFMRLYASMPSIDGILADPNGAAIPENVSTLFALAAGLAYRTTVTTYQAVARYTERLVDAKRAEIAVLLTRDATRRCPAITATAPYIRLQCGPYGKVISGQ